MSKIPNSLKIGFFTDDFPSIDISTTEPYESYICGGVGEVVYNLAIEMAKIGHEVYIFTNKNKGNTQTYNYQNIKIIKYKSLFFFGMTPISLKLIFNPFLSGIKLDIVHIHMGTIPAAISGYFFSKHHRIPMIITYHGDIFSNFGNYLYRGTQLLCVFLSNYLLKKCDKIIALSQYHIDESKYIRKYQEKIVIISNGVNFLDYNDQISKEKARNLLNLSQKIKIILFVGSLVKRKGLDLLIKAISYIYTKKNGLQLIIIGDGSSKQEFIDLSKKLGLEKSVIFKGYLSNPKEKVLYYKSADVFVLPSYSEAYPLTLLEASAAGLPLISSNLECIKAIIQDGKNGLLFTKGNEFDLSEKILILLKNDKLRIELGNQAKKRIQNLSWEKIAKRTEKLYWDTLYV